MDAERIVAAPGTTVQLRYTIRLDDGTAYPPPQPDDRFRFELGRDRVLPGVERAVLGMRPGDTKRVRVLAAEAFGPRRSDLRFRIERGADIGGLRVGDAVRVSDATGQFLAIIEEIADGAILVDANHPLSGKDLTFDLEVLDVSALSAEAALTV